MTWTLELPYERPPKGLHANDRVHHMVRARSAKELRERVAVLCRVAKIPKLQRISVQVGMPWASWHGTTQAVPPVYTEFLGHQLLDHLKEMAP